MMIVHLWYITRPGPNSSMKRLVITSHKVVIFYPRSIIIITFVDVHWEILYAKDQSSGNCNFKQEDLNMFYFESLS
jgi:hypothetical protein